jgi:VanZ family protein
MEELIEPLWDPGIQGFRFCLLRRHGEACQDHRLVKLKANMSIFDRQRYPTNAVKTWLPALAWAALIFVFSTDYFSSSNTSSIFRALLSRLPSGISALEIDDVHLAIRKLGHWSEYLVFALLLLRALKNDSDRRWELRHASWSLALVLLYAISDELHQTFVATRTASISDVMVDVFGGICGILWLFWYRGGIRAPAGRPANSPQP